KSGRKNSEDDDDGTANSATTLNGDKSLSSSASSASSTATSTTSTSIPLSPSLSASNGGSSVTKSDLLKPIASLNDASAASRGTLFIHKLRLCSIAFDFYNNED